MSAAVNGDLLQRANKVARCSKSIYRGGCVKMSAAVNGDLLQRANKVARCRKSFTAAGVSVAAGHRITVAGKNSARHGGQLCNAAQVHFCSSVNGFLPTRGELYRRHIEPIPVL